MNGHDLQQANAVLQRLERFWNSPGAYNSAPVAGTVHLHVTSGEQVTRGQELATVTPIEGESA